MKTLIKILLAVLIPVSVYPAVLKVPSINSEQTSCTKLLTHTERVCINGTWYIIVYGEDGSIINIYEDDE